MEYKYLKSINGILTILVSESEMPTPPEYYGIGCDTFDNMRNKGVMDKLVSYKIKRWLSSCKQYPCADKENEEKFIGLVIWIMKQKPELHYAVLDTVLSQGIKIPNERVEIKPDYSKGNNEEVYPICLAYYIPIEEDAKEETNYRQKLFDYMSNEHGVTLLESDMDEIENIINPKRIKH